MSTEDDPLQHPRAAVNLQIESADQPEQVIGKSNDKCIGNRRFRTILLCAVLELFCCLSAKYLWELVHWSLERESMVDDCASCEAAAHSGAYAADVIFIGLILSMVFLLVMFLMLFTPKCDPNTYRLARIPGIWLLLGATMYLVGWIWWIIADRIVLEYDQLSSEEQTETDAEYLRNFGEALLFSATTGFMAIDVLIPHRLLFDNEFNRLAGNLTILTVSSLLTMPAYFMIDSNTDGVVMIGTGYIIIAIASTIYMMLYLTSCCGENFQDRPTVRIILAVLLIAGGCVTAFGYFWYNIGLEHWGFGIMVGGLAEIWALDFAWDDIKNST